MINTFESVKAMKVEKVTDLSSAFSLESKNAFHIFIAPGAGADLDCGEVMQISAKPAKNDAATTVPIVVGDWNPVVLDSISASAIDLDNYDVFVSEIADY